MSFFKAKDKANCNKNKNIEIYAEIVRGNAAGNDPWEIITCQKH